jgi:hypothetical protein
MVVDDQRFQIGTCGLALKGGTSRRSDRHFPIDSII